MPPKIGLNFYDFRINNLINELSNKLKKICNKGSNTKPKWVLCEV